MQRLSYLKWTGVFLFIFGFILAFSWDRLYNHMLRKGMEFAPDSKAFNMWRQPDVPIVMNVYLFNCTNSHELEEPGYRPHFVQMGPYAFREIHEKVNITWNENNTVSYRQIKRWYYDPEHTNGSLKDNVTMLNVLPVAATYVSRHWSGYVVYPLSMALKAVERTVWITKTVGEHLFEGYSDPLLTIASSLPAPFQQMKIPSDKIGFFYGRNGSADSEGFFNMDLLGRIKNWNNRSRSHEFQGECGVLKGSAGDFFPRDLRPDMKWSMFAPDICRSVTFEYKEETEVLGISGYRYIPTKQLFDNGSLYPEAKCNCGGECLPSGVLNISLCRNGAPGFVSYPHFLGADPHYMKRISGLSPDPQKHSFQVTLEPRTGVPLDVTARLQINLLLQPIKRISMFEKFPKIMFPMIWFEERATLSSELASTLRLVLAMSTVGLYFSISIALLGVLLVVFAIVFQILRKHQRATGAKIRKHSMPIVEVCMTKTGVQTLKKPVEEEKALLQTDMKGKIVK